MRIQSLKLWAVSAVFLMLTLFCSNALAWERHGGERYNYRGGRRHTTVIVAGTPYYWYDNVYYRPRHSGGYVVVPRPIVTQVRVPCGR